PAPWGWPFFPGRDTPSGPRHSDRPPTPVGCRHPTGEGGREPRSQPWGPPSHTASVRVQGARKRGPRRAATPRTGSRPVNGSARAFPGALQLPAPLGGRPLGERVTGGPVSQVLGETDRERVLHPRGRGTRVLVVDDA